MSSLPPYAAVYHTLTGLTLAQVATQLDAELPADAYTEVPGGARLTDIDPNYMRKVLNEVFGLCGLGWGYTYAATELRIESGVKHTHKGETPTFYASLFQLEFWYALVVADGTLTRCTVLSSGASENPIAGYALSGAVTNALGKAVSNIGFQESVYLGKRSHTTVGRKVMGKTAPTPSAKTPPAKPEKAEAKAASPAAKPEKAEAQAATPAAPAPAPNGNGNGHAAEAAPAQLPATPAGGDYKITVGKHSGKLLRDVTRPTLEWYAHKMDTTTDATRALAEAAKQYLATLPVVAVN